MFWRRVTGKRRVDEPGVPACAYFLGGWGGAGIAVSVGVVCVQDECLAVSDGIEDGVLVGSEPDGGAVAALPDFVDFRVVEGFEVFA